MVAQLDNLPVNPTEYKEVLRRVRIGYAIVAIEKENPGFSMTFEGYVEFTRQCDLMKGDIEAEIDHITRDPRKSYDKAYVTALKKLIHPTELATQGLLIESMLYRMDKVEEFSSQVNNRVEEVIQWAVHHDEFGDSHPDVTDHLDSRFPNDHHTSAGGEGGSDAEFGDFVPLTDFHNERSSTPVAPANDDITDELHHKIEDFDSILKEHGFTKKDITAVWYILEELEETQPRPYHGLRWDLIDSFKIKFAEAPRIGLMFLYHELANYSPNLGVVKSLKNMLHIWEFNGK